MKQTAVDWLFKELLDRPKDKMIWYYILEKAKKMEKVQIEDAYFEKAFDKHIGFEEYYQETYGEK